MVLFVEDMSVILNSSERMARSGVTDWIGTEAAEEALQDKKLQNRFNEFLQVRHGVNSSILKFKGQEVATKQYFHKKGWRACGR
jgi:hypothetical protein